MLARLKNIFTRSEPQRPARGASAMSTLARPRRVVLARYDAAATTEENRRHWSNADHLSANAANKPTVRRILRARARYEVANNSYARGIVLTLANDVVGTGPRLQMLTGDDAANRAIEQAFDQWAEAIRLPEKLRTLRMARADRKSTRLNSSHSSVSRMPSSA